MEAILKETQGKFNTTEVNLTNYGHHSIKAIILADAVSEGRFSDADYLATTFPVMVQHFHSPGFPNQPVILCLADTLAEIKRACMRAFGWRRILQSVCKYCGPTKVNRGTNDLSA